MKRERLRNGTLRRRIGWIAAAAFIVGMITCGCFGITMSIRQSTQFHTACTDAGGRVVDLGKDWICIDPEGQVIVP
jgi:hypothetical protein